MARAIKAPNVGAAPPGAYNIINTKLTMEQSEHRARQIVQNARLHERQILDTAAAQADSIISDAQAQAEQIISEANSQRTGIIANAEEEGIQKGVEEGQQAVYSEASEALQNLASISKEANEQLQAYFHAQEIEMRRLVAELVSRVVNEIIAEDADAVVRNVHACLQNAADRQRVRILIHPDDEAGIQACCEDFRRAFDEIEEVSIEPDPRVGRGGVIVETGYGSVDGRVDRQLDILNEAINTD